MSDNRNYRVSTRINKPVAEVFQAVVSGGNVYQVFRECHHQ